MRVPRFYQPTELSIGGQVILDEANSHHLLKVLRADFGNLLSLFNGDGHEFTAQLTAIQGKQAVIELTAMITPNVESPLTIHLGQAVAKGEKMDLIIQKAVELGVSSITPLFTERCEIKLTGERLVKRQQHWQGIIVSACEQSGRVRIPKLNAAQTLDAWLSQRQEKLRLTLAPKARISWRSLVRQPEMCLLVGPEGGLADSEITRSIDHGFQGIALGPRILRTETAALAMLAAVQSHWGDL